MVRSGRALVAGVALPFLLAACGGGTDSGTADERPPPSVVDSETTATPAPSVESSASPSGDEVLTVGESTVFGGFRFSVLEAGFGDSLGVPTVSISVDVENLGSEIGRPTRLVNLVSSGVSVEDSGFGITSDVQPGGTANGSYEFQVDAAFTFEGSTLSIGREGSTQASVALSGGPVVSLEPAEATVDVSGTAEGIEFRLDRVLIDWHSLALRGESSDAGTAFLTAVVDITLDSQSRTAKDTFELVVPGGETVTPEKAPNEVLSAGELLTELEVGFIVPNPYAGVYALRLLNLSRYPEDAVVEVHFSVDN